MSAQATGYYTHAVCVDHNPGDRHPECPARLRSVQSALEAETFSDLVRFEAPLASTEPIYLVHDKDYVDDILAGVPLEGRAFLDPDTVMSPASGEAALRAVGAVCSAVDAVMAGELRNAFCAVRPPGHHAERDRAMGFCLFNNVAIAARYAQHAHGIEKVAVLDFDVHHGNGTQHSFYDDDTVFFGSSHQWPAYPGTGKASETGRGGVNCNVPLSPGDGSPEFRAAWTDIILPSLTEFNPDFMIISAGFDAHERDPLANLNVQTEDYGWITGKLLSIAKHCCDNRVVSSLEGGYDLQALAKSSARHVEVMMTA